MGRVAVEGLGKAYKRYHGKWSRLAEWMLPAAAPRHDLHWVLRDVTFSVEPGEAVAVVGENGAGKSTLLKVITGTTQATEGTVRLEGRVAALLELGMGFHGDFTGRQNVLMAGQLLGIPVEEIQSLMPEIEAFAEIGYYIDEPVRTYSSGMQVRLAFSVATARRPGLLIVDEALSVGDAYFQHKSFGRIRRFQEEGTTLLLVSHDLAAVRSMCTRAVWLDKGRMRAHGDTRAVVDEYAASVYAHRQSIEGAKREPPPETQAEAEAEAGAAAPRAPVAQAEDLPDCRQEFLAGTTLRNDIRAFDFRRDAGRWGTGDMRIVDTGLRDLEGRALPWIMGGEKVRVAIEAAASAPKRGVILGFIVKDRTGQVLFGDNTYLRYVDSPVAVEAGSRVSASFDFRMPVLPRGTYAMAVAVATGTQDEHVVEEWIDEALYFESHNADTVQGLVGIPIHDIRVDVTPPATAHG